MAYDTTEAVAKFLSGFQMKITNRERDTVAPDYYVKYSLTLSKGGRVSLLSSSCKENMAKTSPTVPTTSYRTTMISRVAQTLMS